MLNEAFLSIPLRYTPGDSWHDDANTKQFKGSQGKSGTYLLRLTDWCKFL